MSDVQRAQAALALFERTMKERTAMARAAHDAGRHVVGYLANTVPVELIRAAGFRAVHVVGNPSHPTPLALERMEDFFDGYILSIFEQMLSGELDWLEAVVIPRSSEVQLQLYYHMLEVRRAEPHLPVPLPILFDVLHSPGSVTERYNAGRLDALRGRLSEMAGNKVSDASVVAEIRRTNETLRLLEALDGLRRERQPRLRGSNMLNAIAAAMVLQPDEFAEAAHALLAVPEAAGPVPSGPRIMLTGSQHDTPGFHLLIEELGGNVVADDHMWGAWWFDDPVGYGDGDDPMGALLQKYHLRAPSPRVFPRARVDERLLRAVERSRPDAVIFFTDDWDDTYGFDFPTQRDLLAERGIPMILMKEQSYRRPERVTQAASLHDLFGRIGTQERVGA